MSKIKILSSLALVMTVLVLFFRAYPVEANSLEISEVYKSLSDKGETIEVISEKEVEITEGQTMISANYMFRDGKLRIVAHILGTQTVTYYAILPEGLKNEKTGDILYKKSEYKAAHERKYCSAIKLQLRDLALREESSFAGTGKYNVSNEKGVWGSYLESVEKAGSVLGLGKEEKVQIDITGVPDSWWVALGTHKYCSEAYMWFSKKGGMQNPLSIEEAKSEMDKAREEAERIKKADAMYEVRAFLGFTTVTCYKINPAEKAPIWQLASALKLPVGTIVELLGEEGHYKKVRLMSGEVGWMDRDEVDLRRAK